MDMLHADYLIVTDKEKASIQTRFTDWQVTQKSMGLRINNRQGTIFCAKTNESLRNMTK